MRNGALRALLIARGVLAEDVELVSRYRALADLPEESLGHAFHCHYTDEGLALFAGLDRKEEDGGVLYDADNVSAIQLRFQIDF